jgi:16S rRNA (adenine(1408)-N(1))-methyltransferase
VDPDAAALREVSHSAARAERRGGTPNVIFLVAAAEVFPGPLAGRADLVTIALPWGSLLRGMLTADAALIAGITAVLKPRGEIELLISTAPADGLPVQLRDVSDARQLARALELAGVCVRECRSATADDVARLSSSWGRRLGIPERRTGWILRFGNESAMYRVTPPTTEEVLESGVW